MVGIASTVFVIWYGKRFTRVEADETALYISDYRTEIRVPFSDIENVWAKAKLHGHHGGVDIIKVEFCHPTVFGKQIQFFTAGHWNPSHSIVADLRESKDRAKTQQS